MTYSYTLLEIPLIKYTEFSFMGVNAPTVSVEKNHIWSVDCEEFKQFSDRSSCVHKHTLIRWTYMHIYKYKYNFAPISISIFSWCTPKVYSYGEGNAKWILWNWFIGDREPVRNRLGGWTSNQNAQSRQIISNIS